MRKQQPLTLNEELYQIKNILKKLIKEDTQSTNQLLQNINLSDSEIDSAVDASTTENLVIPDNITKNLGDDGVEKALSSFTVIDEECSKPNPDETKILNYLNGIIESSKKEAEKPQQEQQPQDKGVNENFIASWLAKGPFFLKGAVVIAAFAGVALLLYKLFSKRQSGFGCPAYNNRRRRRGY